uniref:Major sperm protein n=1 Tax=Parastrongyloides trichosuri TaxID=131310 RepID=A0A0N4ZQV2_PARTI
MENYPLVFQPSDKIIFPTPVVGELTSENHLLIKNVSQGKIVVKIKCTSNKLFRISPVFLGMDPDEARMVRLIFITENDIPTNGKHHFSLYTIPYFENLSLRENFASINGKHCLKKIIPIFFDKNVTQNKINTNNYSIDKNNNQS